jgi:uncharacterized protein (UPF0332 family)
MFQHGIKAKSHEGLKTQFFLEYIKTGKIDSEYGKLYSQLIDWRQESDYAEFVDFREEDISPLIEQVQDFNEVLKKYIETKLD